MAGKHRRTQPLSSITLRTTGALIAGATMAGLAAGTVQVASAVTGERTPRASTLAADATVPQKKPRREPEKPAPEKPAPKRERAKKPSAGDVIKLAEKQVGISEDDGGETKFQDWYMKTTRAKETVARDGGTVKGYGSAAWCSMFISWLGDQSGFSDQIGLDAWTVEHAKWFQKEDRWGTDPRPGAIVFFAWSGGKKLTDIRHVGMVVKERSDGKVETVEGNSRNAVREEVRSPDDIVGYGYPDYAKK